MLLLNLLHFFTCAFMQLVLKLFDWCMFCVFNFFPLPIFYAVFLGLSLISYHPDISEILYSVLLVENFPQNRGILINSLCLAEKRKNWKKEQDHQQPTRQLQNAWGNTNTLDCKSSFHGQFLWICKY